MWTIGIMSMILGSMVLMGEYLCVEVAWRCLTYNQLNTALGTLFLAGGLVAVLIGDHDD